MRVEGGKGNEGKEVFPKGLSYAKEDSRDPGGPATSTKGCFSLQQYINIKTVGVPGRMSYSAYLKYLSLGLSLHGNLILSIVPSAFVSHINLNSF